MILASHIGTYAAELRGAYGCIGHAGQTGRTRESRQGTVAAGCAVHRPFGRGRIVAPRTSGSIELDDGMELDLASGELRQ